MMKKYRVMVTRALKHCNLTEERTAFSCDSLRLAVDTMEYLNRTGLYDGIRIAGKTGKTTKGTKIYGNPLTR